MKLFKLTSLVLTFTLMLCVNALQANCRKANNEKTLEVKDAVLGSWDYLVPDVEPAYSKGIMHIAKAAGTYTVNLELSGGTIPTEDVAVTGNKITFILYVEGMLVNVNIVIDGDALTGSGDTDQGAFTMTGTRKN